MNKQPQHTPGPWRAWRGSKWAITNGTDEVGTAIHEPDACLIAAAPELLAALGAAVMAYHQIPGTLYRKEPDWHKQANTAIAAAEGTDAD